jgi:hypothetical protein
MRQENGMRFDHCIRLQERNSLDGKIFDANVLTCEDKPLSTGESIRVGGRAYRYDGDNNLGNSIFTALEPFPVFETIEKSYGNNLFVWLEIYPMKHGHFYVQPYIQSGATSSDSYTRHALQFAGELETREAAEQAGLEAGRAEIAAYYDIV